MTDIVSLASMLFKKIEWQQVPYDVTQDDLCFYIAEAIKHLYVMTGRSAEFTSELFTIEDGLYVRFGKPLMLDEERYVLVTAQIDFFRKVQTDVSSLTSYTTDAMSVSHGDKPFANLQQKLMDLTREQNQIWYKMSRYHM